jgi:uncharacterized protein (TIRG00374 family)
MSEPRGDLPGTRRSGWKRSAARLVSVAASAALLTVLYRSLDLHALGATLLGARPLWLAAAIGMVLPIVLMRALRFFWVAPPGALPGVAEAFRLTLVASALNVFVPAKAGDLAKSYFITRRSDTSPGVAIAIVVYERLCDFFGLIACCMVGLLVGRPQVPGLPAWFWWFLAAVGATALVLVSSLGAASVWRAIVLRLLPHGRLDKLRQLAEGWPDLLQRLHGRRARVVLFSPLLWLTQLLQIWLFTLALSASIPFTVCASLSAVALMAGQVPFTVAGLGARDAALVLLLARYLAPETAAALGILIAIRNVLPPLLGLPMMWPYLASIVENARGAAPTFGEAR